MSKVILVICLLVLAANVWASEPSMTPIQSASVATVPQSTYRAAPVIAEVTPIGRNLSDMIRHSGPFNGVNPTLKSGESLVQLPRVVNGVTMWWQQGHYKAGPYTGYLEKGDWAYVWAKEYPDRTDFTLSRGRCGNPANPVCFNRPKYTPAPPPPVPTPQVRLYTGGDTVLADVVAPTASFSHPAAVEQQPVAPLVGTVARVRNPGSESEHVLGGVGWAAGSRAQTRPRGHRPPSPPPPPPPAPSPYCPPTGGAPPDPGRSQLFDTPTYVPGLSDQPISP